MSYQPTGLAEPFLGLGHQARPCSAWCGLALACASTLSIFLWHEGWVGQAQHQAMGSMLTRPMWKADDLPRCPERNMNYLGMAYDMVKGMPQPWESQAAGGEIGDPGWKVLPVFELGMGQGRPGDGCIQPAGVFLVKDEDCSFSSEYSEFSTAYEFQSLLRKQFKSASGKGFGFSVTEAGTEAGTVHFDGLHIG